MHLYLKNNNNNATETCWINSDICKQFVEKKKINRKKNVIKWETLFQESIMSNEIMQSAWKNNVLILFLSTTHETADTIMQKWKRSSTTSTSAKTAWKSFGFNAQKKLSISIFIDHYNHCMRQVNQTDQLCSYNPELCRIRRGDWHALWNFIFNVILVNCYWLSSFKSQAEFRNALLLALFEKESKSQKRCCTSVTSISDEHKLECWKILQYCSVCNEESTRKHSVLDGISDNSQICQKRKKTIYDYTICDILLCKEGNCFNIHQSIVI